MSSRVRHRAADASAAEQRLDRLLRAVSAITLETDPLRITFAGGRVQRILRYTPRHRLSDPGFWANHLHPTDREDAVSRRETAVRQGQGHTLTCPMIAADRRAIRLGDSVDGEVEGGLPAR